MNDWKNDPENQHKYKNARLVATVKVPRRGVDDLFDIHRVGNMRDGYQFGIATFSGEGTFRFLWLTEKQRREIIGALGGIA